jgi:diguanylate cyclase (GGDEF)-like protein
VLFSLKRRILKSVIFKKGQGEVILKSRLAIAIILWGWLLFVVWLSYDYAIYQNRWVIHIFQPAYSYEIHSFHVLIFLVPFIYTLLGYLVNEREKLLEKIKESEEKFRALSLYDELTNLHNRRGFALLVEQQFKIANRTKKGMLLVYVDVDNMKWINDNLGHKEGDEALLFSANILRMHVRKADILARIGGDEFVAIMNDAADDLPGILCERLEASLQNHNTERKQRYTLSFSIGFAFYDPASPCSIEELLDQADRNMYRNKKGKNSIVP